MRINQLAAAGLLALSALGLSSCASGLPARVERFNAMPAPQGQSFVVIPADPANAGRLEFARYAGMVAQALQGEGYAQAPSLEAATMVVKLAYGVDEGPAEQSRDPFARGTGYDPFYGGYDPYRGYYGRPYYSRFGHWGPSAPFYYGWGDPYAYGPFDGPYAQMRAHRVFESFVELDIRRKADNAQLFDGHAAARSQTDELGILVPNLVEAMFTGFPGRNGETVRITVPAAKAAR